MHIGGKKASAFLLLGGPGGRLATCGLFHGLMASLLGLAQRWKVPNSICSSGPRRFVVVWVPHHAEYAFPARCKRREGQWGFKLIQRRVFDRLVPRSLSSQLAGSRGLWTDSPRRDHLLPSAWNRWVFVFGSWVEGWKLVQANPNHCNFPKPIQTYPHHSKRLQSNPSQLSTNSEPAIKSKLTGRGGSAEGQARPGRSQEAPPAAGSQHAVGFLSKVPRPLSTWSWVSPKKGGLPLVPLWFR